MREEQPDTEIEAEPETQGLLPGLTSRLSRFIARFWGVIIILAAWQGWVWISGYNAIVLPPPLSVLMQVVGHPGLFAAAALETLAVAIVGTLIGMLLGTVAAVLAWYSRLFSGFVTPLVLIFTAVPAVALVPVIARLLGYDIRTAIAIVAMINFFPAFVFTGAGLKSLPAGSADLFRVNGASTWLRLRFLALPAAVPHWMVALRLGAAGAILSAIVAEFAMGTSGLGRVFSEARDSFDMTRALGASLVATVISVVSFLLAISAERLVRNRWE